MFVIFKNDSILNFWANQIGDVFIDVTCRKLKLDKAVIDLNFYFGIDLIPAFYEFDDYKNLIIKKEIITQEEVVTIGEDGNNIVSIFENKTYEVDKIIEPIVYFAKGLMIKPC